MMRPRWSSATISIKKLQVNKTALLTSPPTIPAIICKRAHRNISHMPASASETQCSASFIFHGSAYSGAYDTTQQADIPPWRTGGLVGFRLQPGASHTPAWRRKRQHPAVSSYKNSAQKRPLSQISSVKGPMALL